MSDLTNKILDAIDIMADDKVSSVKFDKTVRATIVESVDPSVGKYKVKYQNSTFFAFANDLKSYSKGSAVYVVIPSSNFESHPYIVGSVSKLGADYVDVLSIEDRLSQSGGNVFSVPKMQAKRLPISFCSYKSWDSGTNTQILYEQNRADNLIDIDEIGLDIYKANSDTILLGASFQTKLPAEQQVSGGNYGIRIYCDYYDAKYKDLTSKEEAAREVGYISRSYELNINKMTGQPYNLFNSTPQKAYFEIDAENFVKITKIEAFCSSFPIRKKGNGVGVEGTISDDETKFYDNEGRLITNDTALYYATNTKKWYQNNKAIGKWENQSDIFIDNFKLEFYETLTEEELQSISLRITYPLGSYFLSGDEEEVVKKLQADLRIKGKRVNYSEQTVHFYWFVKDIKITHDSPDYNQYGGPGWRCLNTKYTLPKTDSDPETGYATGHNPEGPSKTILHKDCMGLVTRYKCVAIYQNADGTSTQASAEGELTNRSKLDSGVSIVSTLGDSFAFNIGKTTLKCFINDKLPEVDYYYYWGVGLDGEDITLYRQGLNEHTIENVDISQAYHFATYECSVYDTSENLIGTGHITLTNGEPVGEYRLVLKDGSRVYKYNDNGIAPNSLALDEYDRITIPVLSFDIYNDLGQLVNMSDDEKARMCDIMWVWPYKDMPKEDNQGNNTASMIRVGEDVEVKEYDVLDPLGTSKSSNRRYVTLNQAQLKYNINNKYDIDLAAEDNNIELRVKFKEQILRAKTTFTFTKDGEQGTNGTPYTTRIVPRNYEQIVLRAGEFYGRNGDVYTSLGINPNVNNLFKVQIWRHEPKAYVEDVYNAPSYKNGLSWSTSLQDRGITNYLTIDKNNVIIIGDSGSTPSNTTIKARLNTSDLSEKTVSYFDSYPIDVMVDTNCRIAGGYREVSYKSDGSRSGFVKKPFRLEKYDDSAGEWKQVTSNLEWWTNWGKPKNSTDNTPLIEPRSNYESADVNTWIKVLENQQLVAYIPIDYHLDRYGLGAINDWDGNSIKINTDGSNYILSPQVGAGQRENDGTFTGITIGKAFEGGSKKIGLLGYHQGARSIFLDSETGNAEFGKDQEAKIVLGPTARGKAPKGAIYSGNFYKYKDNVPDEENHQGMLINLTNPSIKFGLGWTEEDPHGNFEVNSSGHLIAKGGGRIAGWNISNKRLYSGEYKEGVIDTRIYLDSTNAGTSDPVFRTPKFRINGDGSFSANNGKFKVTADGTLTATDGSIAGWLIRSTYLEGGILRLNKDGSLDAVKNRGSKDPQKPETTIWEIDENGVATFTDIKINNTTSITKTKDIINVKERTDEGDITRFSVDNKGAITASAGNIAGWSISTTSISSGSFKLNSNGTIQLGSGFTVDANSVTKSDGKHSGSSTGKLTSTSAGSSHPSGYIGGKGGGESATWQDVSLFSSLTSMSNPVVGHITIDGTEYKLDSSSKFIYKIYGTKKKLRLLVEGKGDINFDDI